MPAVGQVARIGSPFHALLAAAGGPIPSSYSLWLARCVPVFGIWGPVIVGSMVQAVSVSGDVTVCRPGPRITRRCASAMMSATRFSPTALASW